MTISVNSIKSFHENWIETRRVVVGVIPWIPRSSKPYSGVDVWMEEKCAHRKCKESYKIAIISICFSSQAEIHLACRLALVRQPKVATCFHDDGVGHPLLHNFTRASLINSVLVAIILTRLNFPLCGGRLNNISRLLYSLKIATNHLVYDSGAKSFSTSHRWAGMGETNANGNGIHGGCRKFFIGRQGLARDFSNRFFAVRGWKNEARIQTAQRGHTRCGCPIHKHTHTAQARIWM